MSTANGAKGLRQAAFEARAIVLATEGHLVNRARYLGEGVNGEALWQVPSKSSDGVYVVHVWPLTAGVVCNCTAGSYARACGHAGAAILAQRQKESAEHAPAGRDEAMRSWLNGFDW